MPEKPKQSPKGKLNHIEVRCVNNGFVVGMPFHPAMHNLQDRFNENVFETFDSLVKFLKENLDY